MKVLIALDSSKFSDAAVDAMTNRPWWGDTEMLVLSVVPRLVPLMNDFSPHYHEIRRIQDEEHKFAKEHVDGAVSKLKEALPYCIISGEVQEGGICDLIVSKAAEWHADLIVLGSHGRKGWSRFFLGSVAEATVDRAPCSVEIIKLPPVCESVKSTGSLQSALKMARHV
jgi:nucleotide-binding universal stress UspA family protein